MKRKMNNLFPKTRQQKQQRVAERRKRERIPKTRQQKQQWVAERRKRKRIKKLNRRANPAVASPDFSENLSARPANPEVVFHHDINIDENESRAALVKNCNAIRQNTNSRINLQFEHPEMKITAPGMMLLYAEVYRKVTEGNSKITCNYPSNRKAEEVMQHIGFFDLLGKPGRIPAEEIEKADEDVRSWHVAKGTDVPSKEIHEFLSRVAEIPSKRRMQIYGAIKELIANASEHAYQTEDIMKHWVMFGRYDNNYLSIVVGDLGRTIPVTICEHPAYTSLIKKMGEFKRGIPNKLRGDSKQIKFAVRRGGDATRTRESHRGLGLGTAVQKIGGIQGRLCIYSRRGIVAFSSDNLAGAAIADLKFSIQGTIIWVHVPVSLRSVHPPRPPRSPRPPRPPVSQQGQLL